MSTLGNILWIVVGGGIFIFFEYLIGGFLLCLTIIGIPFGLQCIKLSVLGLLPFGRDVVRTETASGCLALIMNILWIILGGIWITLSHILFAVIMAITIIGIPFAKQHLKLASLALIPFGHEVK
jgi:uncharacterized membrane protein YccF (DUF307 family)